MLPLLAKGLFLLLTLLLTQDFQLSARALRLVQRSLTRGLLLLLRLLLAQGLLTRGLLLLLQLLLAQGLLTRGLLLLLQLLLAQGLLTRGLLLLGARRRLAGSLLLRARSRLPGGFLLLLQLLQLELPLVLLLLELELLLTLQFELHIVVVIVIVVGARAARDREGRDDNRAKQCRTQHRSPGPDRRLDVGNNVAADAPLGDCNQTAVAWLDVCAIANSLLDRIWLAAKSIRTRPLMARLGGVRRVVVRVLLLCGGAQAADTPERAMALFADGFDAQQRGDHGAAINLFTEGLKLAPGNAQAHYYLANNLKAVGRLSRKSLPIRRGRLFRPVRRQRKRLTKPYLPALGPKAISC